MDMDNMDNMDNMDSDDEGLHSSALVVAATNNLIEDAEKMICDGAPSKAELALALIYSCSTGKNDMVLAMLNSGMNVDAPFSSNDLIYKGNGDDEEEDFVSDIICMDWIGSHLKVDPGHIGPASRAGFEGLTALMVAAHHGFKPVVETLISKGADPNATMRLEGCRIPDLKAIHMAAISGNMDVVELLLPYYGAVDATLVITAIIADDDYDAHFCRANVCPQVIKLMHMYTDGLCKNARAPRP